MELQNKAKQLCCMENVYVVIIMKVYEWSAESTYSKYELGERREARAVLAKSMPCG